MIDPMVNLAFSLASNRGAYAILVGSGISFAAEIPTGWDVVCDLVRKVAKLVGEDPGTDLEAWYRGKYGKDPDYSELLAQVARTAAERQALMRGYFEPLVGETNPSHRRPTKAHRAIARMVKSGLVRVVLTTNFDRLLETAMQDEGIAPEVLRTPDDLQGASPLAHAKAVIVKLHGDYLDANAKNTALELSEYDPRTNALLDRVFADFGLIVCGWSADYDEALRAALGRAFSKRYSLFWGAFGTPRPLAQQLIDNKKAVVIPIQSADSFFSRIEEHVAEIEKHDRSHPLSIAAAVSKVKRLLADPHSEIELHDLLRDRIEAAKGRLLALNSTGLAGVMTVPDALAAVRSIIEEVCAIAAAWGAWAKGDQQVVLVPLLAGLALPDNQGLAAREAGFGLYPVLLAVYAAGVAATAKGNFGVLKPLLLHLTTYAGPRKHPLLLRNPWRMAHGMLANDPHVKCHKAAFSAHALGVHRVLLEQYAPEPREYERAFDFFEYIVMLAKLQLDEESQPPGDRLPVPVSCAYRWQDDREGTIAEQEEQKKTRGGFWLSSKLMFFDGRTERLHAAHERLVEILSR